VVDGRHIFAHESSDCPPYAFPFYFIPYGGIMRPLALLFACLLAAAQPAFAADRYVFDKTHTNLVWQADHFGFSKSSGKWMDVDGTLTLDESKPETSKVEATINIPALTTGLAKFDEHLLSADFLDAAKYPVAKYSSTKIEMTGKDTAKVTGELTLHGVTKEVVLDVKLNKIGVSPISQKKVAGFHATTTIKRSDFNINYGLPGVSDEVAIDIQTELTLTESVTP
jgi:polyisoprenoid-binding protein YceI